MALDPNTVLPGTGETYAATERTVGGVLAKHQRVLINSSDGPSCDAFGRWRVSNPHSIFDSKLLHGDNQPLLWDESLISGTMATSGPTAAKPFIDFTSTNVTAGKRTRQTFRRFNHQPGKSRLVLITGVLELASGTKTGCVRELGYFDDDNGAFFESNAGVIGVTVRTNDSGSPVDTTVAQASWNLDTMDGGADAANPSGITLDVTKAQIFVIDFQWLSIGRVRFGFEVNGVIHYVHQDVSANVSNIPWTSTPNLPVRFQITTTTSSGVCSMRVICVSVVSEGGANPDGVVRQASNAGASVTTNAENSIFALIGLKLKAAYLGETIDMIEAKIQIHTASELAEWLLIWNPTVADTFTYSDVTNAAVQRALGATANTVTGGTIIDGGYLETGSGGSGSGSGGGILNTALHLGAAIDGTVDEIVLCIRPIGGTSAMDAEGMLIWREES